MEVEGSLSYPQETATSPCPQPYESTPYHQTLCLDNLNIIFSCTFNPPKLQGFRLKFCENFISSVHGTDFTQLILPYLIAVMMFEADPSGHSV
jgi:hypothetical protein